MKDIKKRIKREGRYSKEVFFFFEKERGERDYFSA